VEGYIARLQILEAGAKAGRQKVFRQEIIRHNLRYLGFLGLILGFSFSLGGCDPTLGGIVFATICTFLSGGLAIFNLLGVGACRVAQASEDDTLARGFSLENDSYYHAWTRRARLCSWLSNCYLAYAVSSVLFLIYLLTK